MSLAVSDGQFSDMHLLVRKRSAQVIGTHEDPGCPFLVIDYYKKVTVVLTGLIFPAFVLACLALRR